MGQDSHPVAAPGQDLHAVEASGRPRAVFERFEWAVLGLAFVLRVVFGLLDVPTPSDDAADYSRLGHNLASGHGFSLSEQAPFVPTDWRMPGYPGVLAVIDRLDLGDPGLVVINSLLGALAVAAILLIARRAFDDRGHLRLAAGLAAALFPPLVTYTGLALSENLSIPAVCWFTYVAFFAPVDRNHPAWWLVGWFLASSVLFATRSEGLFLVAVSLLVTLWFRRMSWRFATVMILLTAIAPVAWAIRNDSAIGRIEFVNPLQRDATILLSVNDGDFTSPLYKRGFRLAKAGADSEQQKAYHEAVINQVKTSLSEETGRVLTYKAKSLLNLPLTPVVWKWSLEGDHDVSDAVSNLGDGRSVLRVIWTGILLLQYGLALIGLVLWWRLGKRIYAIGIALYPMLAFLVAIPFHGEHRLWFGAAFILLVPAVEGAAVVIGAWRDRRQRPISAPVRDVSA